MLDLLAELGLGEEMAWERSRTGFYADGKLIAAEQRMDYLRLPALGPVGQARLAFTLMMAARIRDGRAARAGPGRATGSSRWSGRDAFERLWLPLLRAKLGDNHEVASAAFIWATIRRLYLARSSGAKTETAGLRQGRLRARARRAAPTGSRPRGSGW